MPKPYGELYALENKANECTLWTPSDKIKKIFKELSLVFVRSEETDAIEIRNRVESRLMGFLKWKFDKTKFLFVSTVAILSIIINIFQYLNKASCP